TYRLVAANAAGNSPASNSATAGTGPYQPPGAPTGLSLVSATGLTISLKWNLPTYAQGITGYTVYRNNVAVGTTTTTSFTDTGLLPATSYTYTVATVDSTGAVSAKSGALVATTGAAQFLD